VSTIINSQQSLDAYIKYLKAEFEKHKYLRVDLKTGKQRTNKQNACLHKYCEQLAQELNSQGLSFNAFFKEGVEIPWTMEIVKDNIWRPVQKAITGQESTTKPKASEYSKIYEVINRKVSNYGFYIPWPNKEEV